LLQRNSGFSSQSTSHRARLLLFSSDSCVHIAGAPTWLASPAAACPTRTINFLLLTEEMGRHMDSRRAIYRFVVSVSRIVHMLMHNHAAACLHLSPCG
jgi:hypothetical protein